MRYSLPILCLLVGCTEPNPVQPVLTVIPPVGADLGTEVTSGQSNPDGGPSQDSDLVPDAGTEPDSADAGLFPDSGEAPDAGPDPDSGGVPDAGDTSTSPDAGGGCTVNSCGPGLACQNDTGLCVPECGGLACPTSAPHCIEAQCFECTNETHCEGLLDCIDFQCVLPCALVDCPDGTACQDGSCVFSCDGATPCPPGKNYCVGIGFELCVECLNSAHCGVGLACIDYECIIHECDQDAECSQPGGCDNYQCVLYECYSATDCAEDFACANHTCVVPEPCAVLADCPNDIEYECQDGVCITVECWNSTDCGGDTPYCWSVPISNLRFCVECMSNLQCPQGLVCQPHVCVVPGCIYVDDCDSGFSCGTGSNDPAIPAMCYQCAEDAHCDEGFICENFVCVVPS